MEKSVKLFLGIAAVGIAAIGVFAYFMIKGGENAAPGKYDEFAACTAEKGAVFYGAFWCQHCQAQKALFGTSIKKVKYVECSTRDAQGQTPECKEQKIESYPTWIFSDGERKVGEVPLAELAAKTGCTLPE